MACTRKAGNKKKEEHCFEEEICVCLPRQKTERTCWKSLSRKEGGKTMELCDKDLLEFKMWTYSG